MKTKIFIFSIVLVFLFGCNQKKSKIEVIPNYDIVYAPESLVTEKAKSVNSNFLNDMINVFKKTLEKKLSIKTAEDGAYHFGYTLYINENGKVDKIRKERIIDRNRKIIQNDDVKGFTKLIIPEIEKWNFIPAKINGKSVKSRKLISVGFLLKNEKLLAEKMPNIVVPEGIFFVAVEHMPSPIGGIAGIQKRITYPEIARKAGIQGRVFVKAFIDEKGNVVKTEIIRGIGGGCDKVAQKAVEQTKFEPGRQRGKAVKVQVSIPILFRLG